MNPKGCYTALVTPFKEGNLDEGALVSLIQAQVASNINGLILCGTTGELDLLGDDEYSRVMKIGVETVEKKIPIIAGVGSPSTRKAMEMAKLAQNCGVDGFLIITPYYVRQTDNGTLEHFKSIHDATHLPMIVYNNPRRTNIEINEAILEELLKLDRVVGLKDSTTHPRRIVRFGNRFKDSKFSYICGEDANIETFLENHARAWISVVSNLLPRECTQMMGKHAPINGKVNLAIKALNVNSPNPVPIKYAVSHFLGLCGEEVRLPLLNLTDLEKERIHQGIKI